MVTEALDAWGVTDPLQRLEVRRGVLALDSGFRLGAMPERAEDKEEREVRESFKGLEYWRRHYQRDVIN